MVETKVNGKPRLGLTAELKREMMEKRLVQQEAFEEECRLNYLAAQAATAALRREVEGD